LPSFPWPPERIQIVDKVLSLVPSPLHVNHRALTILRVDSGAGLSVGIIVLLFGEWLSNLYQLPGETVRLIGFANVLYGCYSGSIVVAASSGRSVSRAVINGLIVGNLAWAPVCAIVLLVHWSQVSAAGAIVLVGEALFVATLGALELRYVRPALVATTG